MIINASEPLTDLYEADETAWLDAMAELLREQHWADLDHLHLAEYLEDMAKRDRREVKSRLVVLATHVLKWLHQPDKRTGSWHRTIIAQRQELEDLLTSGSLRNHGEAIFAKAYADAVEQTIAETKLPAETFPLECPWTLDQLLSAEVLDS